MKIVLENVFMCLVVFWKYYFPTSFLHFLSFQTNFISKNPPPPTHQHPQKIHHHPHNKTHKNPPLPNQNPPPHNTKTTKTPPQQQQKNQRSKRERLRDWGKERLVNAGGDDQSWVGRERDESSTCTRRCMAGNRRTRVVGLGWWWREQDVGGVGLG